MLTAGSLVGGYRIEGLLGRGAMGEVYRALQVALDRPVAVKRIASHLLDQPGAVARFEREARCLARVHCEHVVAVHDFGRFADEQGEEHWLLVMELVEGMSLGKALQIRGRLDWSEATALARQVADGLAAVAEFGVVHRDLKPDNILLSKRGIAKITDFGLARADDSTTMTAAGAMLGTPLYMPPEACRGDGVDARGDLYSLGCTWFHCLTGEPPYRASTSIALLRMHLEEPVRDIAAVAPHLPQDLANLLAALMAKNPEQRPGSASAVAEAIARSSAASQLPRHVDVRELPMAEQPTIVPTPTPHLGTAPTRHPASASATAATVVATPPPSAPLRRGPPWPAIAIVAAGIIVAVAVVLRPASASPSTTSQASTSTLPTPTVTAGPTPVVVNDPQPQPATDFAAGVSDAIASGDTPLALQRAAAALEAKPGDAGATALVRQAVQADAERLCREFRHDDALKRLNEHRSRWPWLDTGAWEKMVAIDRASALAKRGRYQECFDAFITLWNHNSDDLDVARAIVTSLPEHRRDRLVLGAAEKVVEKGGKPTDQTALGIVVESLSWDSAYGSRLARRLELVRVHYPDAITLGKTLLDNEDHYVRENGRALLEACNALSDGDKIRHHLRTLCEHSPSTSDANALAQWLQAQAADPNWAARKQAARIQPIQSCEGLKSWNDHAELVISLLATCFAEESLHFAIRSSNDADQSLRWNAYRLLEALKALDRIDLDAYHARTLVIFDPLYDSPDFNAALAWMASRTNTVHALAARKALDAGEVHTETVYRRYREADDEASYRRVKERIRAIHECRDRVRVP